MKRLIYILLLLPTLCFGQYPIVEEFNSFGGTGEWTVNNGAGVQNYGGAENWATFNIGNIPYPNSITITIQSPIYDLTTCGVDVEIIFPVYGIVENGFDFFRFQYFDGGVWTTTLVLTGFQNINYTNTTIPNTATRFRFQLITDGSVNMYGPPGNPNVYFYDIQNFTINCASALPIELIDFNGVNTNLGNELTWTTVSELNNNYFTLEHSTDGYIWNTITTMDGAGNSTSTVEYNYTHENYSDILNYYRLSQTDYDGKSETFKVVVIDNSITTKTLKMTVNYLGQEVNEFEKGFLIEIYTDGTTRKIFR